MEKFKNIIDILQGLVIISATIFTAIWTFKTFAHKEKIGELRELKRSVMEYHGALQLYCAVVHDENIDINEIKERLDLARIHTNLAELANLNLYTKKTIRDEIQSIVGSRITTDDLPNKLRTTIKKISEDEEKRRNANREKFESGYKKVLDLIDQQAEKYL